MRLLLWLMTPSVFPSSVCHILGKVLPESKGQRHWIHTFQYWKGALEILQRSKGQREPPGKWGESITFASCKWGETCFWACMIWLPSRGCSSWLCGHSWSCIFYKRGLEEFNLFTLKKKGKKPPPCQQWLDWLALCLTVTEALEITELLFAVGLPCPLSGIWGAV